MVSSKETTPAAYLASLEPDRRAVIAKVRALVKQHLPPGYTESMNWGMLAYEVPLSRYPVTYNKQPLMYAALAAQKNNYALYLTLVHDPAGVRAKLAAAYKAAGRKLDMGQSCLRFKTLDELPTDILGEIIASTSVEQLIARYEASRGATKPERPAKVAKTARAAKVAGTAKTAKTATPARSAKTTTTGNEGKPAKTSKRR